MEFSGERDEPMGRSDELRDPDEGTILAQCRKKAHETRLNYRRDPVISELVAATSKPLKSVQRALRRARKRGEALATHSFPVDATNLSTRICLETRIVGRNMSRSWRKAIYREENPEKQEALLVGGPVGYVAQRILKRLEKRPYCDHLTAEDLVIISGSHQRELDIILRSDDGRTTSDQFVLRELIGMDEVHSVQTLVLTSCMSGPRIDTVEYVGTLPTLRVDGYWMCVQDGEVDPKKVRPPEA